MTKVQLSPPNAIEEYSGVRKGNIKANFYSDCTMIPDPSDLNADEKNLLILDDCFLGSQSKAEAYYTRGRHNNCDSFYISQNYFQLPRQLYYPVSARCEKPYAHTRRSLRQRYDP